MSESHLGNFLKFRGSASSDNEILFTSSDVSQYDAFSLMSSLGSVDVEVTLDGDNWTSAPISLQDFGAIVLDPVLSTVAGRLYAFRGRFKAIRVRQDGATATEATLLAWNA